MEDLRTRSAGVSDRETDVIRDQLARNRVTVFDGTARFVDANTIVISYADGRRQVVDAGAIVIATGSRPVRPAAIEFDEESILDSDGILNLGSIPQSLVVVGAGVIGMEYASMFAAVGTKVTVDRLAPRAAAVLRLRDRARAAALAARPGRHLPPGRDGRGRRAPRERRADHAQERQADRGRDRALLGRAAGRDGGPRARAGRRRDRRARPDPGRPVLPHVGRGHLRRRRRDRLPGARRDGHGAGPHRRALGTRPADRGHGRATADRHLLDPGDLLRRARPRRS